MSSNCLPQTTTIIDDTLLECKNFISSECLLFVNPISYLNLPANSTGTQVISSILTSLIDARNRIETGQSSIEQNNKVKNLYIDIVDLESYPDEPDIDSINQYISTLQLIDKTVLETDSKWNIVIYKVKYNAS
jgi:hypothetical protein